MGVGEQIQDQSFGYVEPPSIPPHMTVLDWRKGREKKRRSRFGNWRRKLRAG